MMTLDPKALDEAVKAATAAVAGLDGQGIPLWVTEAITAYLTAALPAITAAAERRGGERMRAELVESVRTIAEDMAERAPASSAAVACKVIAGHIERFPPLPPLPGDGT